MTFKKETLILVLLGLVSLASASPSRLLFEEQDRKLISVANPDTTRPFPQWLQIVYFILCCLMILGGIAACAICGASKAGYPDPAMNVPGGASSATGNQGYYGG